MKTISRTISVVVFVNLVMAGFALAEKAPEEEPAEVIAGAVEPPAVEVPVPPEPPRFGSRPIFSSRRRGRGGAVEPVGLFVQSQTSGSRSSGLEATGFCRGNGKRHEYYVPYLRQRTRCFRPGSHVSWHKAGWAL